ncbi:MAG: endonuclease/exonuclease/phosphatase family protein, partial [Casimicrobiaceae bacterium]
MPATTIALGVALIILGLGGYGLTGTASLTALIPAAFGLLFVLAGVLARDDRKRMHAMHAAVVVALLGFLGSARGLLGIGKVFDGTAVRPAAIISQTIMALLTLGFIVIAVRSFIQARRARRAVGSLLLVLCAGSMVPALAGAQSPQRPAAPAKSDDFRVMTYNIKHGQTNAECAQPAATPGQPPSPDCNLDLQAAVAVIREHAPDIIGLQEVDRFWARSGYQDEPAVLSAALGMKDACYAANLDHPADAHADRPHQYGTLVLSRHPIVSCSTTPLPRTGANEQRGLTLAVIDVKGVALRFYNTHLHTTEADRLLQTASIAQAIDAADPGPTVMVGDFNATPTAKELEPLFSRFVDASREAITKVSDNLDGRTSPAMLDGEPRNRIDYVFASAPPEVRTAYVPIDARTRLAADHYPVVALLAPPTRTAPPTLVKVAKIWDEAAHNAFTDLIRWRNRWYCTFRESDAHIGGNGRIRVLISTDGDSWTSAASMAEDGIDLRDPKLSITPDDRLMVVAGGSVYEGTRYIGRQPRVLFSSDGSAWSAAERILAEGDWLWRVTWHEGTAYGVTYRTKADDPDEWTATLVSSRDGRTFQEVRTFEVDGRPNETTLRFMPDGEMVALMRRESGSRYAWMGRSRAPYTAWTWRDTSHRIGGPNFIRLPDGSLWASGRSSIGSPKTVLARLTLDGTYEPVLRLPSGGDTSYAGMVWHDGLL